jgi:teichuronic acid exporter
MTKPSTQESVDSGELKHRVVQGVAAYSGRQFVVMGLNIISGLALTRILFPADFGYAATVGLVVGFALVLAEGGLGVYLIQRQSSITESDISRIICFQLLLYFIFQVGLTMVLLGRCLINADVQGWVFVWVAGFAIPFSLLRSGSFILLERSLSFPKIAVVEMSEQLTYTASAITLALIGFGVWSLVFALILRSIVGWRLANHYAPWSLHVEYGLDVTKELRKGLRFGFEYQLPVVLEIIRSAINPVLIGATLGVVSVGYVDRAVLIASLVGVALSNIWRKVLFPFFARIQSDRVLARRIFERSVYLHSVLDKAAYLPLVAFCSELVEIVLGDKWLPIVPIIYIFVFGNLLFFAFSTTSLAILPALGRADVLARLSVVQIIVAWGLAAILVHWYGMIGFAFASVFLWAGTIYMYVHVRRLIGMFDVALPIFKTLLAFVLSVALLRLIVTTLIAPSASLITILQLSLLGLIVYFLILFAIDRQRISFALVSVYRSFHGAGPAANL